MKRAIEAIEMNRDDDRVALVENRPFYIPPATADDRRGFLLVHGFTGTPWEMRDIGRHLAASGAPALGIRLPGHGTSADDLACRRYEEWLAAVLAGYGRLLHMGCDDVVGVGLSTGALLLLAAATEVPFAGLVLLSPYLKLRHRLAPFAGLLHRVVKVNRRPAGYAPSPYYYQDRPVVAVHQINLLLRRVRRGLAGVTAPVLVASSAGDLTVSSQSAIALYNRLGSDRKEFYRFGSEVPHVLTTVENPRQDETLRIASAFAAGLRAD